MWIDPLDTTQYRPALFNAFVAPRPIGWISTVDLQGRTNLAPFSYFTAVASRPPTLMFSCGAPNDRFEKDTLSNVRATGEFVANLVTWDLSEHMNITSTDAPKGEDEFKLAGLSKKASRLVAPPHVAESPVAMECKVMQIVDLEPSLPGDRKNSVVFGRVVAIFVDDSYMNAGRFDTHRARPVARLGGFQYAAVAETFEMPRLFKVE
jgi:flavin reductase (DIM6/NTAB) family NADH-FMN oxidoreductase RutF